MKNILVFMLFSLFCNGQLQSQGFVFDFNPKKFVQENRLNKESKEVVVFNLYDIIGKNTRYVTIDQTSEALRKQNIYSFKGKSEDGKKLITLTIASGKLTGAYLENGISYFIEPVNNHCKKKYKIYTKPNGNYQVGQPEDAVQ